MPETTEIGIRSAIAVDAEALGALGALLMSTHYDFNSRRFIAVSDRTPGLYAAYLQRQLGQKDVILLVAEVGREVAGYIYAVSEGPDYMALRGPAGVIHDIIVSPGYRRKGAACCCVRPSRNLKVSGWSALSCRRHIRTKMHKPCSLPKDFTPR